MFTKMAHEAFMKLKQVRRRSWGGVPYIYIYIHIGFRVSTPCEKMGVYVTIPIES